MFKQFNRSLKMMDARQLLHSQYILYILCLISLMHIIYFASTKDANALFIFLIVGFLTSFFSKNMIVILFIALVITHLLRCDIRKPNREGAENMDEAKADETNADDATATKNPLDILPPDVKSAAEAGKSSVIQKNEDETANSAEKKKELYDNLKKDFVEFQNIQQNILAAMKEIDPLLNRAETFITKFESLKKDVKK